MPTPMYIACLNGHLSVCKWLFEVGAAADVTKANNNGATPMFIACQKGHLSVCKWLFEVGAAADTPRRGTRLHSYVHRLPGGPPVGVQVAVRGGRGLDITEANNNGATPMYIACQEGQLSVCKWLFEVGAAADVTKANNNGATPMFIACQGGQLWGVQVAVRGGRGRGHHQGGTTTPLPCSPPVGGPAVGVQVAVRDGRGRGRHLDGTRLESHEGCV